MSRSSQSHFKTIKRDFYFISLQNKYLFNKFKIKDIADTITIFSSPKGHDGVFETHWRKKFLYIQADTDRGGDVSFLVQILNNEDQDSVANYLEKAFNND